MTEFDQQMMLRAIALARNGLTTTTPNPRVGCVIVGEDQTIVGEGFHARAGEGHAEVMALRDVAEKGNSAQGATAYVTLEPCCHTGRTGPCTDALINAGVARVVIGMQDPNPQVAGKGVARLRDAGVSVDGPLQEAEALALNPGFIKRMTQGLPFVRCKSAMSVDGRTAMASGESQWITGEAARRDVQYWRARSCAIVTGVESVIADDPALTVRLSENSRQPLRVIVDTQCRVPLSSRIFAQAGTTVIACGEGLESNNDRIHMAEAHGLTVWRLPVVHHDATAGGSPRIALRGLLERLAQENCNEVLVETGAVLSGAFIAENLVDEAIIYMAAKLMGSHARPLFTLPFDAMNEAVPLAIKDIRAVGDDWRITATFK